MGPWGQAMGCLLCHGQAMGWILWRICAVWVTAVLYAISYYNDCAVMAPKCARQSIILKNSSGNVVNLMRISIIDCTENYCFDTSSAVNDEISFKMRIAVFQWLTARSDIYSAVKRCSPGHIILKQSHWQPVSLYGIYFCSQEVFSRALGLKQSPWQAVSLYDVYICSQYVFSRAL